MIRIRTEINERRVSNNGRPVSCQDAVQCLFAIDDDDLEFHTVCPSTPDNQFHVVQGFCEPGKLRCLIEWDGLELKDTLGLRLYP